MGTQAKVFWGTRIDGVALYAPVTLPANEIICPECEGLGTVLYDYGRDGFQKLKRETCESCDGAGQLTIETPEEEQ
jgi:DnaJ-class molecular chaperone